MELEKLKENRDHLAAQMAFYSAANAVTLGDAPGALNWPFLGEDRPEELGATIAAYTGFVRSNLTAPAEALFRYAAGRGLHSADGTDWSTVDFAWRTAFTVFDRTLPIFDELLKEEVNRLERQQTPAGAALLAAALSIATEDTILETHGTIFDVSPNMRLLATSSVPTMPALDVDDQVDAAGAGAAPEPAADEGVTADQTDAAGAGGQPTN